MIETALTESQQERLRKYDEIVAMRDILRQCRQRYLVCKDEAKEAKQEYEAAQSRLMALASRDEECGQEESDSVATDEQPSDVDWRDCDIGELMDFGLTEKQCGMLHSAGYETCGRFQKLLQTDGTTWYQALAGVGQRKATLFEDALTQLVTKHEAAEPANVEVTDPAAEPDPDDPNSIEMEVGDDGFGDI